jgi:hypothetical protein
LSFTLITGKKINKEGTWKLGNEPIEETGEYKYLGYFINRSLKSNFHVNSFLKEKADKQLNANKRQFINFDEIFAPIVLFSSMFAKSVIKIEKKGRGQNAEELKTKYFLYRVLHPI